MKAVKGYTKDDYKFGEIVKEFPTIEAAAEYITKRHGLTKEMAIEGILNDTNCDHILFPDGSVIVNEPKFDPVAYKNEYRAKKYDNISFSFKPGTRALIQEHAAKAGQSATEFVYQAIMERIAREK